MKLNHLKRLSLITAIVFCISLFSGIMPSKTYAADSTSSGKAVEADDVAVLVGNLMSANGLGDDWNPANYNGKLTEYSNGIYEGAFDLKPGNYEYKIAMNGNWNVSFKGDNVVNNNTGLDLTEKSENTKVYFRLDLKNEKVYDSINTPEQFKTKAVLTGTNDALFDNGRNWDPSDDNFALDYIGGGIYEKTFETGKAAADGDIEYQYKAAFNGAWGNGEIPGSNVAVTVPKGTPEITVFANYLTGDVTDSVSCPEITNVIRLVGSLNGWNPADDSLKMTQFAPGKFMLAMQLSAGSYEYKATANGTWDNDELVGFNPGGANNKFDLAEDTNVVFVTDTIEHYTIDSVNNANDVKIALGLKSKVVEVKSPVINDNGTITFSYKDENAGEVYLAGNITDWQNGKVAMSKDEDGVWSVTLRVGDDAQTIEYKFIVDGKWINDPCNENKAPNGNSVVDFPEYSGRPITLPGSLQAAVGAATWDPANKDFQFDYLGNGNYKLVLHNVQPGSYEYKIACNYSWDPENYGLKGVSYGSNIPIVVPMAMDITFLYNDDSHLVVNSISYKVLDITLNDGESSLVKLTDAKLTGIYSGTVDLKAGTYDKLTLTIIDENGNKETVDINELELSSDKKVTFYYDPQTGMCFNDASDVKVDVNGIYYNSRIEDYKTPYGASPVEEPVTFSLSVAKDMATETKVIISGPDGVFVEDMEKNGSFEDGSDKWSYTYTPHTIGTYAYYFVASNGSDVKAYGDDDGYFGAGKAANIGEVKNYEFNVCTADFKTPDWLKNGVIYQIFPDRFFNGDQSNDFLQKYGRGDNPYEFVEDWYSLPKDPALYGQEGYPENANVGNKEFGNDFYGGDLKGIEEKISYLKSLGVTVLYLNPIGQSISNHRYDTTNYNEVDPILGDRDDFVSLAKAAEENGMHLIIDGVYNHVADDSIYFDRYGKYVTAGKPIGAYQYWSRVYDKMNDEGMTQEDAEAEVTEELKAMGITDLHYKDWFDVRNEIATTNNDGPLPEELYHYAYDGWAGYDNMPIIKALDGSEYNITSWADEIIDGEDSSARQWLRNGANGLRLDVANEVSSETWRALRKAVKEEGDNAIVGEIWTDASNYLFGDMYDSVMNYRFRTSVLNFVKGTGDDNATAVSAKDSMNELEKMREQYPTEALEAMMNLVGSHDTQRVISALDGYKKSVKGYAEPASDLAKAKMKLIPFLQMTYVGAPTIYYGDEIGMAGCDDPDDRRAFTWGVGDQDLVEWYAELAAIRSAYTALRTGSVAVSEVQKDFADDVMAYVRADEEEKILVAANRQQNDIEVGLTAPGIEDGTVLTNVLNTAEKYTVEDGSVTVKISALNGVILSDTVKDAEADLKGLESAYNGEKVEVRQVPKTEAEIMDAIAKAEDGDEVVISDMNESISMDVLDAIINSGKNITPVIVRGNIRITVKAIKALKASLNAAWSNDFQLVLGDVDKDVADRLSDILACGFNLKTNLEDGNLGADALFEVLVDSKYDGKTLYAYSVNSDGAIKFITEADAENGVFSYNSDTLGGIVILDEMVSENVQKVIDMIDALPKDITLEDEDAVKAARAAYEDLTDEEKKQVTNYDKLVEAEKAIKELKAQEEKPGDSDKPGEGGNAGGGKLPQTGRPFGTAAELMAAALLIAAGAAVALRKRKRA